MQKYSKSEKKKKGKRGSQAGQARLGLANPAPFPPGPRPSHATSPPRSARQRPLPLRLTARWASSRSPTDHRAPRVSFVPSLPPDSTPPFHTPSLARPARCPSRRDSNPSPAPLSFAPHLNPTSAASGSPFPSSPSLRLDELQSRRPPLSRTQCPSALNPYKTRPRASPPSPLPPHHSNFTPVHR